MTNKRKRCVDMTVLLEEFKSTTVSRKEQEDGIDCLVSDFDVITCNGEYAEYQLLLDSLNYMYKESNSEAYICAADKRFIRYLKSVNFFTNSDTHL